MAIKIPDDSTLLENHLKKLHASLQPALTLKPSLCDRGLAKRAFGFCND